MSICLVTLFASSQLSDQIIVASSDVGRIPKNNPNSDPKFTRDTRDSFSRDQHPCIETARNTSDGVLSVQNVRYKPSDGAEACIGYQSTQHHVMHIRPMRAVWCIRSSSVRGMVHGRDHVRPPPRPPGMGGGACVADSLRRTNDSVRLCVRLRRMACCTFVSLWRIEYRASIMLRVRQRI